LDPLPKINENPLRFGGPTPPSPLRPGLTLIELLVALALSIMVIGATLMIYQTNSRFYYQQQSKLEQAQHLRSTLYILSREIRMAGDGLSVMGVDKVQAYVPKPSGSGGEWFKYVVDNSDTAAEKAGLRAIFGVDNADRPDTITVFRTEVESSVAFGQLDDPFLGSDTKLTLTSRILDNKLAKGDVLGLVYGNDAILLTADTIPNQSTSPGVINLDTRFKPGGSLPTGMYFPKGTYVYNLRKAYLTTYWVDTATNELMARYHHLGAVDLLNYDHDLKSSIVISPGIEDLQLRYVMNRQNHDEGVDELTLELLEGNNWVRQIQIGLVSRSLLRTKGTAGSTPISVFNHGASTVADGYIRQALTGHIYLRNY
jgi:type II secretory pathway pseudopilin PulG